jgi:hypothetical protein
MKRFFLAAFAVLLVCGTIFADDHQGRRGPDRREKQIVDRRNVGEEVTLNGKLDWVNGRIVLKTDDKTFFVSGLRELVGFADGLKDGAHVTLAGRARNLADIPEYGFLRAEKVTVNGKDYTLNDYGNGFGGMARLGRGGHDGGAMVPPSP